MTKPELVIWGGFWEPRERPLSLDKLNSHASVSCYFLSEALAAHFKVTQLSSFAAAADLMDHPEAVAALSTFQAGFSRLKKDEPETFAAVRRGFPGKLCSIVDLLSFGAYDEDVLFTVIPPGISLKNRLKRWRSGAEVHHMGWCAAPDHCRPRKKDKVFTLFLDHGHYAEDDYTNLFIEALNRLSRDKKNPPMRVLVQGNEGVFEWLLGTPWHNERYHRAAKVPWPEMQAFYGRSNLFCVTHQESAGLGVIEAAMSGATVLVPGNPHPLISPELIATGLPHILADCTIEGLAAAISEAMAKGDQRADNHARLSRSHSWSIAAANIATALQ